MRLEDDWVPMDETMDPEELEKSLRQKEAQSRAVVLEMVSDRHYTFTLQLLFGCSYAIVIKYPSSDW